MGWMFLKTSLLICLVMPRISSSYPQQLQRDQQYQPELQQQQELEVSNFNDSSKRQRRRNAFAGKLKTKKKEKHKIRKKEVDTTFDTCPLAKKVQVHPQYNHWLQIF